MLPINKEIDDNLRAHLQKHLSAETFESILNFQSWSTHPQFGSTLLMCISTGPMLDDVVFLIKQFLDTLTNEDASKYINDIDYWENSVILTCADINMLQYIIKYVPNINVRNNNNYNALSRVCMMNAQAPSLKSPDLVIIKFLLEHGINVNDRTHDRNKTALMFCCAHIGNCSNLDDHKMIEEAIECLVHSGADIGIKSHIGNTAYDYVTNKQLLSPRLAQLLQGYIRMNRTKRASK